MLERVLGASPQSKPHLRYTVLLMLYAISADAGIYLFLYRDQHR